MKSFFLYLCCITVGTTIAFAPVSFTPSAPTQAVATTRRFMSSEEKTLEDEIEELVQQEMKKSKRMSNLRNEKGVEYAPWMKISEEDEIQIRKVMREKAEARRRRKEEESQVQGNLMRDSAFQELSGTGLKYKVIDTDVELEWSTSQERSTKGFIVKRRAAKTPDFEVLASFENYGPLQSKGDGGGTYRYMDEDVPPGGWFYRITEMDTSGTESDMSQCLVEMQTEDERNATKFGAIAFGLLALVAVVAGSLVDPLQ